MKTFAPSITLLMVVSFLSAQGPAPVPVSSVNPARPKITLLLSASDNSGKPITDLSKEQFNILDNGQSASVTALRRVSDAPLHLAIVLYASKSFFRQEQAAASALVQKIIRPNVDAAFILTAGGGKPWPGSQLNWQTDPDALTKSI